MCGFDPSLLVHNTAPGILSFNQGRADSAGFDGSFLYGLIILLRQCFLRKFKPSHASENGKVGPNF